MFENKKKKFETGHSVGAKQEKCRHITGIL